MASTETEAESKTRSPTQPVSSSLHQALLAINLQSNLVGKGATSDWRHLQHWRLECVGDHFSVTIMPPQKQLKFTEGEKVLCFHGPLLYEAKTVKSQIKEKAILYYVHYQGWNKTWDEWVPETRLLKFNPENLERQKELFESNQQTKGKKKKRTIDGVDNLSNAGSPLPVSGSAATSGKVTRAATSKDTDIRNKKVKLEPNVESEIEFTKKCEIKIKLPDEIKNWLVDDWDLINKQKKLTEVPAKVTVEQILEQYAQSKKKNSGQATELCEGIASYFNTTLGCQLLYKFERPQYQKVQRDHKQDTPMSSVYGIIHLCRLFVVLGQMLVYTDMNEKDTTTLTNHLNDFLKFLSRSSLFDATNYHSAPPEYHRKTL